MRTIVRFFQKKSAAQRQNLAKIQILPGAAPGTRPGKPEQIPKPESRPRVPNPEQKKRPSPEEPDPESPMCCGSLPLRDDLLPDNVCVHIDNLLGISQICGYFTEVILLVFLNGADDIKRF